MKYLSILIFSLILLQSCSEGAGSPRTTGQKPICGNHPIIGTWNNTVDTISFETTRSYSIVSGTWFKDGNLTANSVDKIIDIFSDDKLVLVINKYTADTINVFIPTNDTHTVFWR